MRLGNKHSSLFRENLVPATRFLEPFTQARCLWIWGGLTRHGGSSHSPCSGYASLQYSPSLVYWQPALLQSYSLLWKAAHATSGSEHSPGVLWFWQNMSTCVVAQMPPPAWQKARSACRTVSPSQHSVVSLYEHRSSVVPPFSHSVPASGRSDGHSATSGSEHSPGVGFPERQPLGPGSAIRMAHMPPPAGQRASSWAILSFLPSQHAKISLYTHDSSVVPLFSHRVRDVGGTDGHSG